MLGSKINVVSQLITSYFAVLPHVAYSMTVAVCIDPKSPQQFIHHTLDAIDISRADPKIDSKRIKEIVTSIKSNNQPNDIKLTAPYFDVETSNTRNLIELASLAYLVMA